MRRTLVATGLLLVAAVAQAAPLVDAIAAGLAEDGFYLEDEVDATTAEMEDLVARFPGFYFVGLAAEVPGGVQALADDLVDVLGDGTVVVLTPEEVGAATFDFNDVEFEAAFSDAQFGESYAADFEAFATQLSGPSDVASESGGISWVPILIGVGIVGVVGFAIWRGGRRSKQASENLLTEARTEIRQQMDVIASSIVDFSDDPRVESIPGAEDHYRQASETFQAAEGRLAAAQTLPALEDLSDDLDRARWQLDATQALIEGKPPPPEPQPEAPISCFFDPTHGAGREQTTLETAAGNKVVMVCDNCADRLRRGEIPDPRQIPYGGQLIPAPQAPRSHGGQGMDWLDLFSVLVGGMGSARSYDWSRTTGLPSRGRVSIPPIGGSRGSARGSVGGRRGSGARGKVAGSRKRG